MNRQEFIDSLRQRLTEEGFPSTYIDRQCDILAENLSALDQDTADQYTTARNIDIIVRKLLTQDGNLIEEAKSAQAETPAEPEANDSAAEADSPSEASESDEPAQESASDESAEPAPQAESESTDKAPTPSAKVSAPRTAKRAAPVAEYKPCDKPLLLTFLLALICAPTLILFLTTAFGLFAGIFLSLAASIFVIVIAIIGIVGVGSVVSLASLLYGATQILSSPRYVGFHEIGFGLIVAGATMASSILLYNLAIRWIPFISEQMGKLFKLFFRKLISFAKNAVKGCEQL